MPKKSDQNPYLKPKLVPHTVQPLCPGDITPGLVKTLLKQSGKTGRDVARALDINYSNINAWVNGLRTMSAPVKAMFYLYFKQ